MKKRIVAMLLAMLIFIPTVHAYTDKQVNTADALNELQLFLGTGTDYELDNKLTRAQGITLLVRMIGQEEAASDMQYTAPFTDVDEWAKPYVNYAWNNKITNGISDTEFDPEGEMTDYMFLTLTLRVLGYSDSGENPEFVWDAPYALAQRVGLISTASADRYFTRGDAILIFWSALTANGNEMADDLIRRGVFTRTQFNKAVDIQKNGRTENVGVPVLPWVPPVITPPADTDPVTPPDDDPGLEIKPVEPPADTEDDDETPVTPPVQPEQPGDKKPEEYTYEEYIAMSGEEQQAFLERFDSMALFFAWLNAAKAEYDENQNDIEIGGDGSIDLGEIVGGNN